VARVVPIVMTVGTTTADLVPILTTEALLDTGVVLPEAVTETTHHGVTDGLRRAVVVIAATALQDMITTDVTDKSAIEVKFRFVKKYSNNNF